MHGHLLPRLRPPGRPVRPARPRRGCRGSLRPARRGAWPAPGGPARRARRAHRRRPGRADDCVPGTPAVPAGGAPRGGALRSDRGARAGRQGGGRPPHSRRPADSRRPRSAPVGGHGRVVARGNRAAAPSRRQRGQARPRGGTDARDRPRSQGEHRLRSRSPGGRPRVRRGLQPRARRRAHRSVRRDVRERLYDGPRSPRAPRGSGALHQGGPRRRESRGIGPNVRRRQPLDWSSGKEPRVTGPGTDEVSVLVVDDEEPIRNALKEFLAQQRFEVYAAASGEEALQQLRRHRVALMLCDIRMPGTSGVDLVPQAIEVEPDLAILMLTAVNDATSAALCMQRGAMDYLTKPIDLADLGRAVQRALKRREMLLENRHLNQWLKEEVTTRTAELQRERVKLERISVATLEALVNALEAKDPYMRGHSARVADLSATIAAELGMSDEQVEHVRVAGRLHDIGKIGTREAVLNKQGALSPEEFEHVKQHVVIGSQILAPLPHLEHIIAMVRSHHERWDGTGYPDGLRGEEIPLGGRVIATAEVYDALCTSRPYQEKLTPEQTVERMADLAGTVLDPKVYEALATVVSRRRTLIFLDEGATDQPESPRPPASRDHCRHPRHGIRGAPSRRHAAPARARRERAHP